MVIKKYRKTDETKLLSLIESDPDWIDYIEHKTRYIQALQNSVVYIIIQNGSCIGYIRGKDDHGFGFYVYDLLVKKAERGRGLGKHLIDHLKSIYTPVYVMSDVDPYYEKIGMNKIGSIFE